MRFYCTSTGPMGGLNCEVLLYLNWSHTSILFENPVGSRGIQNQRLTVLFISS